MSEITEKFSIDLTEAECLSIVRMHEGILRQRIFNDNLKSVLKKIYDEINRAYER